MNKEEIIHKILEYENNLEDLHQELEDCDTLTTLDKDVKKFAKAVKTFVNAFQNEGFDEETAIAIFLTLIEKASK